MHMTSYHLMEEFVAKHLDFKPSRVLEVGTIAGGEHNYSGIFQARGCELSECYMTLDIREGAHYVVDGYDWDGVPKNAFDVVVSGQVFEHDKFFWKTLANIREVCKPNALVMIIVPSRGGVHRFPLDCYRFYEDASIPFAELLGAEIVEVVWNEEVGWGDLGMVFRVKKEV